MKAVKLIDLGSVLAETRHIGPGDTDDNQTGLHD